MYNNQLETKALLLNSSSKVRKNILNSGDAQLIDKFETWIDLKEKLAKFYTLSKERLIKGKIDIDLYEKKANLLERELTKESEVFSKGFSNKDFQFNDITSSLAINETAIEIIRFRLYDMEWTDSVQYAILMASKGLKIPKLVLLEHGNLLEHEYFNCYKNMIRHQLTDYDSYKM